ncbi:spore germination protein [Bacillus sp. V5-8f]|uniref:spore germination protein n=1 Tax=Bacillus sp. V5-8f TaxID=2053044 RepID=UPI000C7848A2|nr:spore germination protein [Bacillus sp. V5-8f]PLT34067.1 spore germination protein [Bacillus sp. V5-8f]
MKDLKQEINCIKNKYDNNPDFMIHRFEYFNQKIAVVFMKSLCDEALIKKGVIEPLLLCERESKYILHLLSLPSCEQLNAPKDVEKLLLEGNALVCLSGNIYSVDVRKPANDEPLDSSVEQSVQGPQKGLSEDLTMNMTLIRNRYPSKQLKIEQQTVGTLSKTRIAILYDVDYVQEDVLDEIKNKLSGIKTDIIQAAGQLHNYMTKEKFRVFPTMMITERPDRLALNLSEGKVIILMNGTPFGLVAPSVFYDFISAMDDKYHTYWVARLMMILRYMGLFITTTLPALYIAITSYNPEIVRSQLALTIAGSRAGVPYPSFFEVFFMMLAVEMLVESSLRLPKTIGPTATTVGGLILGQAAQQAQLVSSMMIIITAFVAISNFTIPINAMSFAVRCTRYPLIIFASFYGIVGVVAGLILLLCYLSDLRSFGKPYLKVYWGNTEKFKKVRESRKEGQS